MAKKIMTLDDLYMFFVQQNKSFSFSAKESGEPIIVTTNGLFATEEGNDMPGMLKLKLKVCHTETNRNGSHISKENMEKAMPTLKYRPILAYIHELPDGTKDFYAHNVIFEEDENGDTQVVYLEKQVGCFTVDDPWLEYDEDMDKTYVMAYAVIPEEYTEAADIVRRKNGTKVSCELVINELSYNAKEKYLDLTDFFFGATTLLGCDENGNEIGEGMLGARADITDFCHKEPVFEHQDKLIETLEKLNATLSSFNKSNSEEGGDEEMDGMENIVVDEELNTVTEEVVVEEVETTEETHSEEETTVEETSASEDGDEVVVVEEAEVEEVTESENFEIKFELSHDDARMALYELLNARSENGYYSSWIVSVYDNKFIYEDCEEYKFFRQGYSKDGDNIVLDGEPVEVFNEWLSKDEKDALDALKSSYAELKAFKDNYDAAEIAAQKSEIFAKKSYEKLADVNAFKELKQNAANFSVDEVREKAKLIYADFMEQNESIEEDKSTKVMSFNFNKKETKKSPYGNLFNKD